LKSKRCFDASLTSVVAAAVCVRVCVQRASAILTLMELEKTVVQGAKSHSLCPLLLSVAEPYSQLNDAHFSACHCRQRCRGRLCHSQPPAAEGGDQGQAGSSRFVVVYTIFALMLTSALSAAQVAAVCTGGNIESSLLVR
jgi:hypothetical protein